MDQEAVKVPSHVNVNDVKIIREWTEKQPHLPYISDRQISVFLHSCYLSMELTKKTIDQYYTIRTHAGDLFQKHSPDEILKALDVVYCVYINDALPNECCAVMIGLKNDDPAVFNLRQTLRMCTGVLDILLDQHNFLNGVRLVFHADGFTITHFTKITSSLSLVSKIICFVQIYVHPADDLEQFYKFVPLKYLPSDYGGNEKSLGHLLEQIKENVKKYEKWFMEDDMYGHVDETKRVGKAKNPNDVFGIDGSFKKLDID